MMKTTRMTLLAVLSLFSSALCFGQNLGNAQPQPMVPEQQLPRAYTLPLPLPTSPDLRGLIPIDSIIQEDMDRIQKETQKGQKRKEKNCEVVKRSKGSITFVVDENLPAPQRDLRAFSGDRVAGWILKDEGIPQEKHKIVAASFLKDELIATDKDIFFQCMILSYSDHRPVCISPDMVWMLISQGFARYVNAHPEELRDQLVYHTGKMDLVVKSKNDLLSDKADWERLLDVFAAQIDKHTKGNIATTLTADFSTTSLAERIASQITLMESLKAYFNYKEVYLSCGIPTVTLTGTPQDWQRVLDKTRQLKQYGLNEWIQSLEPILQKFVHTAEGRPNQKFWKGMVKKHRVKERYGGGCGSDEPTKLDGWMLKLFPDKDGKTLGNATKNHHMPAERVRVNFKHIVIEPVRGDTISETDMELTAGFVGVEMDSVTGAMTPKIGWLVRLADNPE